jgi:hypothetical protein
MSKKRKRSHEDALFLTTKQCLEKFICSGSEIPELVMQYKSREIPFTIQIPTPLYNSARIIVQMSYDNERIYVRYGLHDVLCFCEDGRFIESRKLPHSISWMDISNGQCLLAFKDTTDFFNQRLAYWNFKQNITTYIDIPPKQQFYDSLEGYLDTKQNKFMLSVDRL